MPSPGEDPADSISEYDEGAVAIRNEDATSTPAAAFEAWVWYPDNHVDCEARPTRNLSLPHAVKHHGMQMVLHSLYDVVRIHEFCRSSMQD
jgi:hypothetical protein